MSVSSVTQACFQHVLHSRVEQWETLFAVNKASLCLFRSLVIYMNSRSASKHSQSHKLAFSMFCTARLSSGKLHLPWTMLQCVCEGPSSPTWTANVDQNILGHIRLLSACFAEQDRAVGNLYCQKQCFSAFVKVPHRLHEQQVCINTFPVTQACFQHALDSMVEQWETCFAMNNASVRLSRCLITYMNSKSASKHSHSHRLAFSMFCTARLSSGLCIRLEQCFSAFVLG